MKTMKTLTISGVTYEVNDPNAMKETDETLSESGKAADAKAVGDAIGDINAVLDAINGEAV